MRTSGKVPTERAREHRIAMEIVVDAYTESERAVGWYCYLEVALQFPFRARCIKRRAVSPLRPGDEVDVVGMAPEEECAHEMFVLIPCGRRRLACHSPNSQASRPTGRRSRLLGNWHYWTRKRCAWRMPDCRSDGLIQASSLTERVPRRNSRAPGQPGTDREQIQRTRSQGGAGRTLYEKAKIPVGLWVNPKKRRIIASADPRRRLMGCFLDSDGGCVLGVPKYA